MYLVRAGWRTVNLEYMIEAADSELGAPPQEATPGHIRLSVYPGKNFEVGGDEAARLRLHLDDNLKPTPTPGKEPRRQRDRPKAAAVRTGSSTKVKSSAE